MLSKERIAEGVRSILQHTPIVADSGAIGKEESVLL